MKVCDRTQAVTRSRFCIFFLCRRGHVSTHVSQVRTLQRNTLQSIITITALPVTYNRYSSLPTLAVLPGLPFLVFSVSNETLGMEVLYLVLIIPVLIVRRRQKF